MMKAKLSMFSSRNQTQGLKRTLVVINFLKEAPYRESTINFDGIEFTIKDYCIGWNFDRASQIIERLDGEVDGFSLSGVREYAAFGNVEATYTKTRELVRCATKTPVYTGVELQSIFANWTLRRADKSNPGLLTNKHILFHTAVFTPFSSYLAEQSARLFAADPTMLQLPFRLNGRVAIESFLRASSPLITKNIYYRVDFLKTILSAETNRRLRRWVAESDVFVTYASLMKSFNEFSCFNGKTIIIDSAPPSLMESFRQAGASQIIQYMPDLGALTDSPISSFGLLQGLVDQLRQSEQSEASLSEYTLDLIERSNTQPQPALVVSPPVRRCGFVVHPLSASQLFASTGLSAIKKAPPGVRRVAEEAMSHMPIFHFGQVIGAKSDLTGQEVICDLYAITATPKSLLKMNEERLYSQLVKASHAAKKHGALMMGLGAYTKVAGDAGVTVSRRAPLPITTGNSYSAAATLWAARVMVEKMQGYVPDLDSPKMHQDSKAMVIGATGSIGRVSSLLLAESFKEIVLVATRPDKLLELRDEILEANPKCQVKVATNPDSELATTDLIVTATSSRGKRILDIMLVKPGAVICDCSRPLDISAEEAAMRPDVMIIESGEIDLPGMVEITANIGLPKPSVYACLAETVLLTMEGRYECFSLSRNLSLDSVKEIYSIGRKHGAKLSAIHGYQGVVTDEVIKKTKELAAQKLKTWNSATSKQED
jgi:predicted amino acid dehydrogenase